MVSFTINSGEEALKKARIFEREAPNTVATAKARLNTETDVNFENRRGPFRPNMLVSMRHRKSGEIYAWIFQTIDFLALISLAYICARPLFSNGLLNAQIADILPFLVMVFTTKILLNSFSLYRFGRNENLLIHLVKVVVALGVATVLGFTLAPLSTHMNLINPLISIWESTATLFFLFLHLLWWKIVEGWRQKGMLTPNIVIVGATRHAQSLIDTVLASRDVNILGIFDDRLARNPDMIHGVPVLGDTHALLSHKITPYVDQIVIALDPSAKSRVRDLIANLKSIPNEVSLLVDIHDDTGRKAAIKRLSDMPLALMSGKSEDEKLALHKRLQDIVLGTTALIIFSPIMLITAIAIKMESPGPVFFRQKRHGFNNEVIKVWKFRSMRDDCADATASLQITKDDARVTRVGRVIRKTSIDELPQLFNVLSGEMSLVGPRPHAIGMKTGNDFSAKLVAEYAWRHRKKPGMTGWAAIHGSRGPLHNADDVSRRITLDIDYIERQSFWLDLYIMMMTIPCILGDTKTIR